RLLDEHGRRRDHGRHHHRDQHLVRPARRHRLARHRARQLSALTAHGTDGTAPGTRGRLLARRRGRRARNGRVVQQSFVLFLAGMALFGTAQTSNLLARYAAADISPGAQRGRAMGLIVWGSTVGSIIGPMLMAPAIGVGAMLGVSRVASAFLISVVGYTLAAILVEAFLRPDPLAIARRIEPSSPTRAAQRGRETGVILREPRVIVAYGALMVSQLVMIGTTSTSPLYLHDHGHAVGTIGLAVSMHLGGMYIASPLSGWLCDRFGRLPMIGAGGVVLLGALALAGLAPGRAGGVVMAGLFLHGVGLDLAFVSVSALPT